MRRTLAAAAVAGLVVAAVATARSSSPVPGGTVDLGADASVVLVGPYGSQTGTSVARAGDVNGDGHLDLVVGAPEAGDDVQGAAYVVYGPLRTPVVDLTDLGDRGFEIDGAGEGDHAGYCVAPAGDVNHDGYGDVLVGAPSASPKGRDESGAVYVVFGSRASGTVQLGDLGRRGFEIDGVRAYDYAGFSTSTAGDVNRDGLPDVFVGAPALGHHQGYAAVVYGRTLTTPVDLAGRFAGFRIDGVNKPVEVDGHIAYDETGASVALAGDVNGDRRLDLVVGSPGPGNRIVTGNAYVLFMPPRARTIRLGALGSGGFRIQGAQGFDYAGESVAAAGDVNGDGLGDVITGGTGAHAVGFEAGAAYVVFGRRSTELVDLEKLGGGGFRMDGAQAGEYAGWSVGAAGNAGGNALPDVFVGAPGAKGDSGAAYVVLGKRSAKPLRLRALGANGFRLEGLAKSDFAGASVANAGDMNGDGQPDLAVGAPAADYDGRQDSGIAYVVFVPRNAPPLRKPPPPLRCVVPAVEGQALAAAKRTIEAASCTVGRITRVTSVGLRAGVVVSQTPRAGANRPRETKVSLAVSRGPGATGR